MKGPNKFDYIFCHYSAENHISRGHQCVLVIDGATLSHALGDHGEMLRELCHLCIAVLCCRMSPLQKAEVSKFVVLILKKFLVS